MSLTSSQRKFLRGLGQRLKPQVFVGKQGASPSATAEVDRALARDELVKVKVTGDRATRDATAAALATETASEIAGNVGQSFLFYRAKPEGEERIVPLPEA